MLLEAPRLITEAMAVEPEARALAHDLAQARDVLYLGRGQAFPLALEGALKLKEISYIHAEGYAAGELKHGPIALVDEATPVIVIAPSDALFEKTVSNMQEVAARGGPIVLITDADGAAPRRGLHAHPAGAELRPADRAAGVRPGDPAARLPCGRAEGAGRGPAAQPGQVGHG